MPSSNIPIGKFPKTLRLLRKKEFERAFREGRQVRTKRFRFQVRRNDLPYPRLGLAVGLRAAKKAVDRNRIKRLCRETFRLHRDGIPAGWDIVANPTVSKSRWTLEEVAEDFRKLGETLEKWS